MSNGGGRFTYQQVKQDGWLVAWRRTGALLGYVERKRGRWQPYVVADGRSLLAVGAVEPSRAEASEALLLLWQRRESVR